jgi:hypothetical protein
MFSLLTYGLTTVIIGAFFYLDGHHIVKNNTVTNYRKFRKLNKLVATNYKGVFTICWVSICMIIKALWINIWQYLNSTIVELDGYVYKVTYIIKGKTYKMIVRPKRGPRKVLLISDEKQEDVCDEIFPYLGPEENFHGEIYTPSYFNKEELIFELSNGSEQIFKKDDQIILT